MARIVLRYYSAVNGDNLVFYFLSTATEKYELLLITAASVRDE